MNHEHQTMEGDLRLMRIWLKSSKSIYNRIVEDVKSHGLTLDHFSVLELLYNKGPQHIQTISDKLMIPSGSITYVVNKLEGKDLVYKEQEETNKRFWKVCLTDQGEALFKEIFPKHLKIIEQIFQPLDDNQKVELAELMKIVGLHVQEDK